MFLNYVLKALAYVSFRFKEFHVRNFIFLFSSGQAGRAPAVSQVAWGGQGGGGAESVASRFVKSEVSKLAYWTPVAGSDEGVGSSHIVKGYLAGKMDSIVFAFIRN